MRYCVALFIICLGALKSWSCGWWPESDLYFFYNLFDQTSISGAEYYPFLRTDDHTFYDTDSLDILSNPGNLQLWKQTLPKWSAEQIQQALTTDSDKEFEQLWNGKKSAIEQSAKQYMVFARKCSTFFAYRNHDSWDYQDILDQDLPDVSPLLEEGMKLFKNEKDKILQIRYAYQLTRILHYSRQYQGAVDFFQNNVASKFEKNELYYYALDQVGGCYYSLENYDYAAYLYIQVFSHSLDRKKSAFLSYNFCTNQDVEGKPFFENAEDTIGFVTIKNLRSFSDDIAGIEELMKIAPADERTELLFMRAINNLERRIWPTHIGMGSKFLPYLEAQDRQQVRDLVNVCTSQNANPKVINKDFWKLASSYLNFLNNDISKARQELNQINTKNYHEQKEILRTVYDVFSWEHMTGNEEKYLAPILNDRISEEPFNQWDALKPSWKYLLMDQAAHLYYADGNLAKAFLVHNRIETLEAIGSLPLIEDLVTFVQQKEKNEFEKILMRRASQLPENTSALDYLIFIKGLYYLQQGDAKTAYSLLNESSLNTYSGQPEALPVSETVYATIFSNNITECFNCTDSIMMDSVYLSPLFSFIEPVFSKGELALYLIKLDSLTKDPKPWKTKLAHYLLANYYFNVSNTGYFRGTLTGQSNCCSYRYFFDEYEQHHVGADLIDQRKGYNLLDITAYYKSDNGLAKKAFEEYQQVIALSADKELNARCLYMMAKCELNAYYNSGVVLDYGGYDGTVDAETKPYKTSFKELKKEYKDTKFYKLIIKECSFFRYYCSI